MNLQWSQAHVFLGWRYHLEDLFDSDAIRRKAGRLASCTSDICRTSDGAHAARGSTSDMTMISAEIAREPINLDFLPRSVASQLHNIGPTRPDLYGGSGT